MAICTDVDELRTLLSEQSEELVRAKTIDADLDVAFQLQMQEVVNTSLASQPSASTIAPSSSSVSSLPEREMNGDVPGLAATLMLEDVQSFTQRLADHEKCQAEMRRMVEDVDRWVFYRKFTREILHIPEPEWRKYDDNFHRPYYKDGASSSSSSSRSPSLETEYFKMYFKGLVSE